MEEKPDEEKSIFGGQQAKKSLTDKNGVVALAFCCFVMSVIIYGCTPIQEGITDLWGNTPSAGEIRASVIKTIFIFFPVLSFLLGFLMSAIPYKRRRYREKYLSFSLLTLLGIYAVVLLLRIISFI